MKRLNIKIFLEFYPEKIDDVGINEDIIRVE